MKKCYSIALSLLVFILMGSDAQAQSEKKLPMTLYKQQGINTCWAACMRMVLNAGGTFFVDEMSIRRMAFSPDSSDLPNRFSGTSISMDRLFINNFAILATYYTVPLSPTQFVNEIDGNLPVIVRWEDHDAGMQAHAVVIKGYEGVNRIFGLPRPDSNSFVIYNDPLEEIEQSMDYKSFTTGEGLIYKWTETLVVHHPAILLAPPDSLPWEDRINNANTGDTIIIPPGTHRPKKNAVVPAGSQNVVLNIQSGASIHFSDGASEIWVGPTGSIIGSENVTLSHDIRVYNTPYPRVPEHSSPVSLLSGPGSASSGDLEPDDKIIGLFSNLCDALYRGGEGRTIKVGPGVYDFNYVVGDQGLIGTKDLTDPANPATNSILRVGFGSSGPGCSYSAPETRPGNTTFVKDMRIEFNNDVYGQGSTALVVYGDGVDIFESCVFEGINTSTTNKNVTALQLGSQSRPLSGLVEFRNCTFNNLGTAVFVDHPMLAEQSPVFVETIFDDNGTDLRFNENSQAFCGLEYNQIKSIQVGQALYTNETDINNLINGPCASAGMLPRLNLSVADPGFVDPFVSDFRLNNMSPMIAAGTGLEDIGAYSRDAVFTFSDFLDGRVEFGGGQVAQFENGALTINTVGASAAFRFRYAQNLRPVYELKFRGGFINTPSTVTVWRNVNMPAPNLPDGYVVWDASVNGVPFAKASNIELLALGTLSKSAVPKITAPAPVSGINVVDESGDVVLTWNRNTDPGMSRYKLFRAPAAAPYQAVQIASLPADITEYRDVHQQQASNIYSFIAYDSIGNMSASSGGGLTGGNKIYGLSGFGASVRDTLRVTPLGVTVQIQNTDYQHGAMITVRNRGHNDSLVVEWYGNTDQNQSGCESRRAELFGNGAQINNFVSPKRGNGTVLVNIRSATTETYLVDIEIYNWANGPGCQ